MIISQLIKRLLTFLLVGLRPLLGPAHCRYEMGCTMYACEQLKIKPLHKALWNITKRLLTCSPFI